jgi:outer membrane lipoprotein-sorting protein
MKGKAVLILAGLILLVIQAASATDEDPYAIIDMVEERQNADTGKSEISMLVYPDINDKGNHRDMRLLSYSRGQDESYMEFITPKSIQGLRILSVDGNQWVYFPSTGRVRKIASKSKDESVSGVGGDFSYEDLGGGNLKEKYNLSLKESTRENWVIEGLAKADDSVYSRIVMTIDKGTMMMMKAEYHSATKGHYKDLLIQKTGILGGREIPVQMVMVNREKNSMTVIVTHSAEFDIPVDDRYFDATRFHR